MEVDSVESQSRTDTVKSPQDGGGLSIVVPVYNEQDNILPMYNKLTEILSDFNWRLIFINDGSVDDTGKIIDDLSKNEQRVKAVNFTRNFGHMAALTAGFDLFEGDALITLDGDLQHPPELIPEMIERWRNGAKIVQGIRNEYQSATL